MNKKTYKSLLESENWRRYREAILKRDNYTCQKCKKEKSNLEVHHKLYFEEEAINYPPELLITLCKHCHDKWHKENDLLILRMPVEGKTMKCCPHCSGLGRLYRGDRCFKCNGTGTIFKEDEEYEQDPFSFDYYE